MIKVAQYFDTVGSEKFKTFLSQPFSVNMLRQIDNVQTEKLFDGWRGKDMGTWSKFTNDENFVLEFYPTYYTATPPKSTAKFMMPLPLTINEFVNDMYRCNVQLYWTEWIEDNFEPKDYLNRNEIRDYFIKLLTKMDKSHELL